MTDPIKLEVNIDGPAIAREVRRAGGQSRGLKRERELRNLLSREGWVVVRAAKGPIDLVCMRHALITEVRLVQVKSGARGPMQDFPPSDRQELLHLAEQAGAGAWLIWWPPYEHWRWIPSSEWP